MENKIYEILPETQISLNITSQTKDEALKEMVGLMESNGGERDEQQAWNSRPVEPLAQHHPAGYAAARRTGLARRRR